MLGDIYFARDKYRRGRLSCKTQKTVTIQELPPQIMPSFLHLVKLQIQHQRSNIKDPILKNQCQRPYAPTAGGLSNHGLCYWPEWFVPMKSCILYSLFFLYLYDGCISTKGVLIRIYNGPVFLLVWPDISGRVWFWSIRLNLPSSFLQPPWGRSDVSMRHCPCMRNQTVHDGWQGRQSLSNKRS